MILNDCRTIFNCRTALLQNRDMFKVIKSTMHYRRNIQHENAQNGKQEVKYR